MSNEWKDDLNVPMDEPIDLVKRKRKIPVASDNPEISPKKSKAQPADDTFCIFSRNTCNFYNVDYLCLDEGDTSEDEAVIFLEYVKKILLHPGVHMFDLAISRDRTKYAQKFEFTIKFYLN